MTRKQIARKLEENGIVYGYKLISNQQLETTLPDFDAAEKLSNRIGTVLGWGGYRCGHGSWVLAAGYRVNTLVMENID